MSPQEQQARAWLAQGRWRKARDEFKLLCKVDRPRFLPLLVEANVGLIREMLAKGQNAEAQQVLEYLKTIVDPTRLRAIELELAGRAGDFSGQIAGLVECLVNPATPLPEPDRLRLADQLVLSFQPLAATAESAVQLAAELQAVHEALAAVAEGQNARANEQLRLLPHRSVFSHWKLFLKGLVAFHEGHSDKAARFFDEVPPETVPGRARRPYLLWLEKEKATGNGAAPPESVITAISHLAGAPQAARMLLQAEHLWREQRPRDMYRLLRDGIGTFPSHEIDWIGTLSTFCYHCLFILPTEQADELADFWEDLDQDDQFKNQDEQAFILRALCHFYDADSDPVFLQNQWRRYLELEEKRRGSSPKFASQAWTWLGDQLCHPQEPLPPPGSRRAPDMPDAPAAIQAFQQGIDLDPTNLDAHVKLAILLNVLKRNREHNRLVDLMTRRFPDHKPVLVLAGQQCISRGAYAKGVKYLERAWRIDRLDPALPEALASAKIHLASQHYRERHPEKARLVFDQLDELIVPGADHALRSRWAIQLRRGLFEDWQGNASEAAALLEAARAASPDPAVYCLLAVIVYDLHAPRDVRPDRFIREFQKLCQGGATIVQANLLLHLHGYMKRLGAGPSLQQAERLISTHLKKVAFRKGYTREEVRRLCDLVPPDSPFEYDLEPFIQTILKQDRNDPLFRLYRRRLGWFTPGEDQSELQQILDEAIRRRDDQAIQLARKELKQLNASPFPVPIPTRPPRAKSPEFSGSGGFDLDKAMADMPFLEPILELLRNASEAEIRRLEKSLPKEIPKEMFDALVDVARGKVPMPPLPPLPEPDMPKPTKPARPPRPVARPSPPSDPNQLDLF